MKLTPVLALSALLTLPGAVVARTAPAQKSGTAQVRIVQCALKVNGMHCQGCAEGVRAALLKLPGVKAAEVDYERGAPRALSSILRGPAPKKSWPHSTTA